jgi:hypothetical protein
MAHFRTLLVGLFLLTTSWMKAQDSTRYTTDFRFEQGIYLNYDQFIHNTPIPKTAIVSNYDKSSLDFLRQALAGKSVTYTDNTGAEVQLNVSKLWGFSENNSIYIRVNNDFSRIMVLGKLCHFTAYITTYTNGGTPDGYGMRYGAPVERLQQYVLDTQTGSVLEFNLSTMEQLLKRDPALYDEFMKLKKRKRKQVLFVYLRKYNDKYGLYLK